MANLETVAEKTGLKPADIEVRLKHLGVDLDSLTDEEAIAKLTSNNKLSARRIEGPQREVSQMPELKERPAHPNQLPEKHQQTQTQLQQSVGARDAIRQEQAQTRVSNARERGETIGSIEAIEEFVGRIDGYNTTSANLYRLEANRDREFYEELLGELSQPSEGTARAYQNTQEVEHHDFLEEWNEAIDLEAAFATS
jgi:hypothetical protein